MMPQKQIPPDWYFTALGFLWTVLAGVLGAVLRQILTPSKGWTNRLLGWMGGAICSVYMAPTLSHIIVKVLNKYDLIDQSVGLSSNNIAGLAGLLSGAVGITFIESFILYLKKKTS